MKINRIISAINEDNMTYGEYVPLTSLAWKKIANIVMDIAVISNSVSFANKYKHFANIHHFYPLDIDSGIQAKVSRLALASSVDFREDNCMIVDIDMLPLHRKVIDVFECVPENNLAKWGWDHPCFKEGSPDFGKWPMDKTSARGSTFAEIINPLNLSYSDLIYSWFDYNYKGKEAVNSKFCDFSDESLLRALFDKWKRKQDTTLLNRSMLENSMLSGRIDRLVVNGWNINNKKDRIDKLSSGEYFECHLRPLSENVKDMEDILDHLGVKESDLCLQL